jgi:hypothetical protein
MFMFLLLTLREEKRQSEEDVKAKKLVREWFQARYTPVKSMRRENFVVGRKTFRDDFINPVLAEAGYKTWNGMSKLYRDWFLPIIMGEDARLRTISKPFAFKVISTDE